MHIYMKTRAQLLLLLCSCYCCSVLHFLPIWCCAFVAIHRCSASMCMCACVHACVGVCVCVFMGERASASLQCCASVHLPVMQCDAV